MSFSPVSTRALGSALVLIAMVLVSPASLAGENGGLFNLPFSSAPEERPERPVASGQNTLQQLLAFALANNPEVSAVTYDGRAAQARTGSAVGARLPRVTIEGGYTSYSDDLRLVAAGFNGESGVFGDNILATDLVLRLPLFTGGKLVAEVRAAELLEASAGHRLARSREDLIYNISSLYFSSLAQEQLIAALSLSTDGLVAQLKRVNELIAARKAAAVDALRSEVKLAEYQQRLLREKNSLAIQRQALLNLMGASGASADFSLVGTLVRPDTEQQSINELVEKSLQGRPDTLAARAELDAQSARVDAARAGHWPTINLVGAFGNRSMSNPTQQPAGQNANEMVSRIGITMEIPLYEGGRTSSRVNEENAKFRAQRERFEKLSLQIRLEVATAHANLESALDRLNGTERTVLLAKKVIEIEREKYALARGILLDVLDAQNALLEAEATHIKALADANTARAQLVWAMGDRPL